MSSISQLLLANWRMMYRDRRGFFWSIAVPVGLYMALAALPIPVLGSGQAVYKSFVLPGVIAYVIMQSGIYSLAYWMVDLKSRGVLKRFLVTPLRPSQLIASVVTSRFLLILLQTAMITLIGVLIFGATFAGNIISTLILVALGSGIFLTIGLLISNYASSYQAAAPLTAAIGMPLAFLGDLFFPISILPQSFQQIANILPITYLAHGLRAVYLEPFSWAAVRTDIAVLAAWLVALLLVSLMVFRLKEE